LTTEFRVLGLSGRDGGSDEELVASNVEFGNEGAEFIVGFELAAAARAVILWSIHGFGCKRCVELTCGATALPRFGWRHGSHGGLTYRIIWVFELDGGVDIEGKAAVKK
jgi:hypothetical protein